MGIFDFLTQSLGLLGRPIRIPNMDRKFGEANFYTAIQIEHDGKYDKKVDIGYEEVLLFTEHEIQKARERARKNTEDIAKFLEEHKIRNAID